VAEGESLLLKNRIFLDRTQGVGVLSKELALSMGASGPVLRSTGVDYDVRKDKPYLTYGEVDFDVPVGEDGDTSTASWSASRRSARACASWSSRSTC
jgi:NADH-quinone oxidoreductase subunit D